jgi:hypothetical protein
MVSGSRLKLRTSKYEALIGVGQLTYSKRLIILIAYLVTMLRPPCGSLSFEYMLCNRTHPYSVTHLPIALGYFQAKPVPLWIPQLFSNLVIIHLLAYKDGTECSETSAYKIQTPGNYPEENIQHTEHGESLKSRGQNCCLLRSGNVFPCTDVWQ